MLATLVAKPFDRPDWVYEEKYDGYRILTYKEGDKVTLLSRNDNDRTLMFHGVAEAVRALPAPTLLLDGEVVALDRHDVSRFQLLQHLQTRDARFRAVGTPQATHAIGRPVSPAEADKTPSSTTFRLAEFTAFDFPIDQGDRQ
jgi:ATP-dependent DNA ligase